VEGEISSIGVGKAATCGEKNEISPKGRNDHGSGCHDKGLGPQVAGACSRLAIVSSLLSFRVEGEISPLVLERLLRVVKKTKFLPRVEMTMGAVAMTKGWDLRWLEPVRD
jgi:hypothetical protein